MEDSAKQERDLILTIDDDEPETVSEHHHHHHHHKKKKKKRSKAQKVFLIILIVLCSILVLSLITGACLYFYMFGKLNHDTSLDGKTDAELGISIVNNTVVRQGDASIGNSINVLGDAEQYDDVSKVPIGGISLDDLPEEVLALLDLNSDPVTSYLKDGADQIENFVIFGTDIGNYIGKAADSIIIVSIDRVHNKVKLISVARDTYAYVPERGGYTKLAWTHMFGGAELTLHTLNTNLYLNLRDYVRVDIKQLPKLVNLIGGVDMSISQTEADYMNRVYHQRSSSTVFVAGKNHFDGDDVVAFSRMRKSDANDSDNMRTSRQRKVLEALLNKVKSMSYTDYPSIIREGMGLCTTSYSNTDISGLVWDVVMGDYKVESYGLPADLVEWKGAYINDLYYAVYNKGYASDAIYRVIYEDLYVSGYDK
ncbi:MAG: LCP family protein [Clostridia bacterium]|nr:LCP family protein [Clostridia bacterium]